MLKCLSLSELFLKVIAGLICLFGVPAGAHTIDVLELPNGGGTRVITDGTILATFPEAKLLAPAPISTMAITYHKSST